MVSISTESVQEWFDDQLDSVAKSDLSNTLNNPDIIGKYFTELDQEQQDLVLGAYLHMAKPDINIPDLEEEIEAGGYSDDNQPNADKGWKSYPAGTSHFESKANEVDGNYMLNGMKIGRVTDLKPKKWFGKVELADMPEFAEYGLLDQNSDDLCLPLVTLQIVLLL